MDTSWLIGLDAATLFAMGVIYATFRDIPKDVRAIKEGFAGLRAEIAGFAAWKEEVDADRHDHEGRIRILEQE